jgi:hypothetical protein
MIQHINEMLKRVQHDSEKFSWFVIPNQVLNWIQDLSISGSRSLVFRVLKLRPVGGVLYCNLVIIWNLGFGYWNLNGVEV